MMFSLYTLDMLAHVTFFIALVYSLQIRSGSAAIRSNTKGEAFIFAVFVAFMLGLYDIGYGYSADRERYAYSFLRYVNYDVSWEEILAESEWMFQGYQKVTSFLGEPQYWFVLTALIYVFNNYIVAKRLAPKSVFLLLLAMLGAFCFRGYGVNTIRAGLALSFVLVGLTYYRNIWKVLVFFFIAYHIHHSTAIPIAAFLVARYYNRPKFFYYFWFLCIVLSAAMGGFFTGLFSSWGNEFDSRTSYLTTVETHYNVGFRIDFVLYSCLPIIIGYIYQNRLYYKNEFYSLIHSTYIIANAFWVLVIRANFSDRFAYLSWFMYALVMMYPLLENPEHFKNVRDKVFWTLLGINLFTYFMFWR
ncbi:hypothetical protein JCM10556A_33430 [Bacteroides acidifaciens]